MGLHIVAISPCLTSLPLSLSLYLLFIVIVFFSTYFSLLPASLSCILNSCPVHNEPGGCAVVNTHALLAALPSIIATGPLQTVAIWPQIKAPSEGSAVSMTATTCHNRGFNLASGQRRHDFVHTRERDSALGRSNVPFWPPSPWLGWRTTATVETLQICPFQELLLNHHRLSREHGKGLCSHKGENWLPSPRPFGEGKQNPHHGQQSELRRPTR